VSRGKDAGDVREADIGTRLLRCAAGLLLLAGASLPAGGRVAEPPSGAAPAVGIVEHLGETVPLDLEFRDESGRTVRLGDLVDRPTVLSLVYYSCPGICTPLLTGLAEVLNLMDMRPGEDYRVITVSFDASDTPKLASEKKRNYLNLIDRREFPAEAWSFLTGDQESIDAITQAVGFGYEKQGRDFVHAAAIYVLSPKGKIVRYLYGTTFLPLDLKLALTEASQGRVGPTINKILLFCFNYDPDGRKYVLNTTRIAGTAVLLMALGFVIYLGAGSRRRAASDGEGNDHGS